MVFLFLGQHPAVTVINNFYAKEELEYYTKIQGNVSFSVNLKENTVELQWLEHLRDH